MTTAQRFRAGVEAGDIEAMIECLADDVAFRSPVTFKTYETKPVVGHILRTVFTVFEDFRYENELTGGGADALHFFARVGERDVEGIDLVRENADGLIDDFAVFVRPLSGLQALAEQMQAKLGAAPS